MEQRSAGKLANDLALAVAALLGTQGPFRVRLFPAQAPGDVGWASVELMHAGAFRALAVVEDVMGTFPAVTMLRHEGKVVLRGHKRIEDGVAAAAAKWVTDGELDTGPVTALDLMCDALPYVGARIAVAGGWWRASIFGEWDPWNGSGVSFDVGGDEWGGICWFMQQPDGVMTFVAGPGSARWPIASRAELPAAFERLTGELRAALAARTAFRARPLPIGAVGQKLLAALRAGKVARNGWTVDAREQFPGACHGCIVHKDDLGPHVEATLREDDGVVEITIAGGFAWTLRSDEELQAAMGAMVDAVRLAASRLSADKLRPGARYRVLRAFHGVEEGRRLTYFQTTYFPKDGGTRYEFGGGTQLWDINDPDIEVLAALHEYLALDLLP